MPVWCFQNNCTLNVVADCMLLLLLFALFMDCIQEKEWKKRPASGKFILWLAVLIIFLASDVISTIAAATNVLLPVSVAADAVWLIAGGCVNIPPLQWEIEIVREHTGVPDGFSVILTSLILAADGASVFQYMTMNTEKNVSDGERYRTFFFMLMILGIAIFIAHMAIMITYRKYFSAGKLILMIVYAVGPTLLMMQTWWKRIPANLCVVIVVFLLYLDVWKTQKEELVATRLDMMRSQIQPHFIYNSLSAIASLCDIDPAQAKQTTLDFSEYLETNLSSVREKGTISFLKELRHVDAYLRIEKTRFGDFLKVDYRLRATDFELPPLTVQPLVENAVKHGLCPSENGGTVTIETMEYPDGWRIVVRDDGVGYEDLPTLKKGIGIENVRQRVAMQCNGTLTIESEKDVGTVATVFLPKGRKK